MSDFSDSAANVSEVWLEISIKFDRFRYQMLITSDTEAFAWLFDFCESTSTPSTERFLQPLEPCVIRLEYIN